MIQKKIIVLVAFALCACFAYGHIRTKIAGALATSYRIVYSIHAEPEEGACKAKELQNKMAKIIQVPLPMVADSAYHGGNEIMLLHSPSMKTFNYKIVVQGKGKLLIDGGGDWAMSKAIDIVVNQLKVKSISTRFKISGSVMGEYLFPRPTDSNLRILDDNIWDYSSEEIPSAWQKIGIDPRDDARAPDFAQLVRAYMPDVLTLQEYSEHMHDRFYRQIEKYGYKIADEKQKPWNNTPIFYNSEKIELVKVNYVLYTPEQWSNKGSKSFTSAVLKQKSTGKLFAVITTHLWWKGEDQQPGSTQARAAQVRLIMAEAEVLKAKYDCPIFVTGDMNCEERSIPIQQFILAGYQPCYKVATIYGNNDNGHHICSPNEGFSRKSNRKGVDREIGAIDHCFIWNAKKNVEVKVFDCIQSNFTVKLTDHYPNLIDAVLK